MDERACYAIDHAITTGGNCTAEWPCYYKDICPTQKASGVHAVCYAIDQAITCNGKCTAGGDCVHEEICPNLITVKPHAVCYSIGAMNSEGMMSDNPRAGIHETDVARTIDANGSNPACYQGGDLVVIGLS